MFVRRHLEACVLTYLAEELRTGDIAVVGAQAYADWAEQLLSPAECTALLPATDLVCGHCPSGSRCTNSSSS